MPGLTGHLLPLAAQSIPKNALFWGCDRGFIVRPQGSTSLASEVGLFLRPASAGHRNLRINLCRPFSLGQVMRLEFCNWAEVGEVKTSSMVFVRARATRENHEQASREVRQGASAPGTTLARRHNLPPCRTGCLRNVLIRV